MQDIIRPHSLSSFLFLVPCVRAFYVSKSPLWKIGTIAMFIASYMCNTDSAYCKIDYDMIIVLSTIYVDDNRFSIGVIVGKSFSDNYFLRGAVLLSAITKMTFYKKYTAIIWLLGLCVYHSRLMIHENTNIYLFLTLLWHFAVTYNLSVCCGNI